MDWRLFNINSADNEHFLKSCLLLKQNWIPRRWLLARDSTLTQSNKLTLYKLLIRPILTYAAPVCSSSYPSNYLRLPVIQSKCLRVIGNFPRRIPTSHVHDTLNIEPIRLIIHRLAAKYFAHRLSHPNPLALQIANYILADRTAVHKKYNHEWTKHVLL